MNWRFISKNIKKINGFIQNYIFYDFWNCKIIFDMHEGTCGTFNFCKTTCKIFLISTPGVFLIYFFLLPNANFWISVSKILQVVCWQNYYYLQNVLFKPQKNQILISSKWEDIQSWNWHILRVWTSYGNSYFYWFPIVQWRSDFVIILHSSWWWQSLTSSLLIEIWQVTNYDL